jgi:hypothetical protein
MLRKSVNLWQMFIGMFGFIFIVVVLGFLETGSCCEAQAALELVIFLLQPPEC